MHGPFELLSQQLRNGRLAAGHDAGDQNNARISANHIDHTIRMF